MKKLILLFGCIAFIFTSVFAGLTPALTIQRTATPKTPDGDASDWGTTWVNLTANRTSNTTHAITNAKFQAAYNDTYLWIVVSSTGDATVDTDGTTCPNTYERDCFEIMLAMDTTSWGVHGVFGEGEGQYRLVRGLSYGNGARFDDAYRTPMKPSSQFAIGQIDNGTSYVQEWQFPWAQFITDMQDSASSKFGPASIGYFKLEIQNADNSTGSSAGRTQQIFWRNNSDNAWDDSRTFSLVKMADIVTPTDSRLSQTITFNPLPAKVVGNPDFSPGAYASSGLPITYASNNLSVATIISSNIHIVGAGTATITAYQAGNGTYKPAYTSQLLTVTGGGGGGQPGNVALTIKKTSKPVNIDGIIDGSDPWTSTWITLSANSPNNTTSYVTAQFQMTYDNNYLWLVTKANGDFSLDTSSINIPNWWENDCWRIDLKLDTTSGNGKYREGDFELAMKRGAIYPNGFTSVTGGLVPDANFKIGQVNNDSAYIQEWQLPWSLLKNVMKDSGTFDDKYFKFELNVTDNTTGNSGGRTQVLFWRNNSDNEWDDTRTFSLIKLDTDLIQNNPPPTPTPAAPALVIKKTSKPVKPDGIVDGNDPWGTTWEPLTANTTANTTNDVTGKFQMTYNDQYLWLVVKAEGDKNVDTSSVAIPNSWDADCIEVFFKMDTNSHWNNYIGYAQGDYQFRMKRGAIFPNGVDDYSSFLTNKKFTIGQVNSGTAYVQEWQLPWSSLVAEMKDSGNFNGQFLKFEVQIADNTKDFAGGRTQQLFWRNNTDNEWFDTRTFSLVKLETPFTINSYMRDLSSLYNCRDSLTKQLFITVTHTIDSTIIVYKDTTILVNKMDTIKTPVNVSVIDMQDVTNIINLSGTDVQIKMFPNPAKNMVILESSSNIEKYEIYNLDGTLLEIKVVQAFQTFVNVLGYKAGTYVMRIYTSNGIIGNKLVIKD